MLTPLPKSINPSVFVRHIMSISSSSIDQFVLSSPMRVVIEGDLRYHSLHGFTPSRLWLAISGYSYSSIRFGCRYCILNCTCRSCRLSTVQIAKLLYCVSPQSTSESFLGARAYAWLPLDLIPVPCRPESVLLSRQFVVLVSVRYNWI